MFYIVRRDTSDGQFWQVMGNGLDNRPFYTREVAQEKMEEMCDRFEKTGAVALSATKFKTQEFGEDVFVEFFLMECKQCKGSRIANPA